MNQANGRADFSAAEAAYLEYVTEYGSIKANPNSTDDAVTYTYFTAAGKGILNFKINNGQWIAAGTGDKVSRNTDVSKWTVDTALSDNIKVGDNVAKIWTIHMDPENGRIKGYYCAFPAPGGYGYAEYQNIVNTLANNGDTSKWQQK